MATFVLVHGAFVGACCWRWVAAELRAGGHAVFAPTLTGLGERAHLASPRVDLETHIEDVANLLRYEDLNQVILVGWSYGGTIVAGAADRITEQLAHLVTLIQTCRGMAIPAQCRPRTPGYKRWPREDARIRAESIWRYVQLAASHAAPFSDPHGVAQVLLSSA